MPRLNVDKLKNLAEQIEDKKAEIEKAKQESLAANIKLDGLLGQLSVLKNDFRNLVAMYST